MLESMKVKSFVYANKGANPTICVHIMDGFVGDIPTSVRPGYTAI